MQDNFRSKETFSQRTDDLAAHLGCELREIPEKIKVSPRSFYGYRSGKYPLTAKALRKLESAEAAAGLTAAPDPNADSSTHPNQSGVGNPAHPVSVDPRRDATLAASREFNEALEPDLRRLVKTTLRQLDASLSTATLNDGRMQDGMIRHCHEHIDAFHQALKAHRLQQSPESESESEEPES